jgi:hypothetical protein
MEIPEGESPAEGMIGNPQMGELRIRWNQERQAERPMQRQEQNTLIL